jgi:hypothetical protein
VQQYGPGMDETQNLAVRALRELLDIPDRNDWDELLARCVSTHSGITRSAAWSTTPNDVNSRAHVIAFFPFSRSFLSQSTMEAQPLVST